MRAFRRTLLVGAGLIGAAAAIAAPAIASDPTQHRQLRQHRPGWRGCRS